MYTEIGVYKEKAAMYLRLFLFDHNLKTLQRSFFTTIKRNKWFLTLETRTLTLFIRGNNLFLNSIS